MAIFNSANGNVGGNDSLPSGAIIMWYGEEIPDGWALCDGTNGTPDLRGRFVLGGTIEDIGNIGGSEEVILTVKQIPKHDHSVVTYGRKLDSYINTVANNTGLTSIMETTKYTSYVGENEPHENMPPYYVLCYIMKL